MVALDVDNQGHSQPWPHTSGRGGGKVHLPGRPEYTDILHRNMSAQFYAFWEAVTNVKVTNVVQVYFNVLYVDKTAYYMCIVYQKNAMMFKKFRET